jgi:acyl-CoA thioester hydrolase
MLEAYRYVERFRTTFHDCDILQHVNNVAYVVWSESIRCNYFNDVMQEAIDGERGWIMAKQSWDYRAQVNYLERVAIGARISRFGTKSIEMIYEVWNDTTRELAATGTSTLVAYDFIAKASIAVPESWRERVRAFETTAPAEAVQPAS